MCHEYFMEQGRQHFEKQLFGKFKADLFVAGDPFIAEKATETWQK